jgi:hypothetical protein
MRDDVAEAMHIHIIAPTYIDRETDRLAQVGFLTEWQRYAQHLEEYGTGEKLDKARLQKMSGG